MGETSMISAIFETLGSVITEFASVIGNGFEGIISLFWDGTAVTNLGTLLLVGSGAMLVYWAFRLVRGLFRIR